MPYSRPAILVVDDEVDARSFLFSLLDSEGFPVTTCEGWNDALRYVAQHKPAVVVSDVRMPDMDGMELLSKIKHLSPGTLVILVSAYADDAMYWETLERGGENLLTKPFRNEELLRAVQEALKEVEP